MGLLILMIAGGVLGWLAAILTTVEDSQGVLENVLAGTAGAVLGALIVSRESIVRSVSADTMLWAVVGAFAVTSLIHVVRRQTIS